MSAVSMMTSAARAVWAFTGQKATPSPATWNMSMSPGLSPTATTSSASTPSASTVSAKTRALLPGGTAISPSPVNSPSAMWMVLARCRSMPRSAATRPVSAVIPAETIASRTPAVRSASQAAATPSWYSTSATTSSSSRDSWPRRSAICSTRNPSRSRVPAR